ncbi:MAG: hypothetical protein Q4C05_09175 [Akkermansia sp.]|nr:hypothetical protein [Akkermansia sp.]
MTLHIDSTIQVKEQLKREKRNNYLTALSTSVLSVLLGASILYTIAIVVARPETPQLMAYVSPENNAPPNEPSPPVISRELAPSSSPQTQVAIPTIIAQTPSPISLPVLDIDMPEEPAMLEDGTLDGFGDFGSGLGDGTSAFGGTKAVGSTLEGTFYDTKQTPGGRSTGMNQKQYNEFLVSFIKSGWNPTTLNKYYKAPQKLFNAQFYIPRCPADDAPKAYNCDDRVKASFWVAIYRGKVKAPKTGTFRFVGAGDDYLAVRFNNETVLDYGWESAAMGKMYANNQNMRDAMMNKEGHEGLKKELREAGVMIPPVTFYKYSTSGHWNNCLGGVAAGKEIKVQAGKVYPIEILISEGPGGEFGTCLLLEEVGLPPLEKDSTGSPILPLFRTNNGVPKPDKSKEYVPFDKIGPVWESVK